MLRTVIKKVVDAIKVSNPDQVAQGMFHRGV